MHLDGATNYRISKWVIIQLRVLGALRGSHSAILIATFPQELPIIHKSQQS